MTASALDTVLAFWMVLMLVVALPIVVWLGHRSERPKPRAEAEAELMRETRDSIGYRVEKRERYRHG